MLEDSLVVDSRFGSRRKLVSNLREMGTFAEVVEAKSVADALGSLKINAFGACLIGSSLSEAVACDFISRGKKITRSKGCAFVAVVEPGSSSGDALISAGADGTLEHGYGKETFTFIVQRAVGVAQERVEQETRSKIESLSIGPKGLIDVQDSVEITISELLHDAAREIRGVAKDVALTRRKVKRDGTPSLATRDAIRLAFQHSFREEDNATDIGTINHLFITALVDWITDRIQFTHTEANERLRHSLLEYTRNARY